MINPFKVISNLKFHIRPLIHELGTIIMSKRDVQDLLE